MLKDHLETIASRLAAGDTQREIASSLGFSSQAVSMALLAAGLRVDRSQNRLKRQLAERDMRAMRRYGCSWSEYQEIPKSARSAYLDQKRNAQARGIGWEFKISEWWRFWVESGRWHERGKGRSGYVMGRRGDVGPYSQTNVYICSQVQNLKDSYVFKPATARRSTHPIKVCADEAKPV